jgi:hypothetical protein
VHKGPGGYSYWVSGTDERCESKYTWCEADRPFAKWIKWGAGENTGSEECRNENCALFDFIISIIKSDSHSRFTDYNCGLKKQFICEVIIIT